MSFEKGSTTCCGAWPRASRGASAWRPWATTETSPRELAYLEQVSIRTLEDWAERGDGPPFRKAGRKTSRRRYPLGGYLDWRDKTTMTCTIQRHKNAV
jgi:hypothetical protein